MITLKETVVFSFYEGLEIPQTEENELATNEKISNLYRLFFISLQNLSLLN